jgi:DNA helicase II / ATP-dependent DNA helicase PcrA
MTMTGKNQPVSDSAFKDVMASLNDDQRVAVEHLEDPMLVIAGPGTGKTQIIAARIGNILTTSDTQAQPQNILCLTYTDAGTIAMRKRLLDFMGPMAYRVNIYTFHAFCNEVIQQNLDYFGKRILEPISELETIDILRELIDNLDNYHPLKRFKNDAYFEVDRLQKLFDLMKREDWTVEHINNSIDSYLVSLPTREEFIYKKANSKNGVKVGDLKQEQIDGEVKKMETLRAAAGLFPLYQEMMLKRNRYDYSDMILWVIKAFKEDENFLRGYQERYLYFLVDEFQDTNGAQNEILNLLSGFWEKPNVFCVGDDDQSIYEFQGARLKNILEFYEKYKDSITSVVLKENYRSTQAILDVAKTVIDNNNERLINSLKDLNLDKTLVAAGKEVNASAEKPAILEFPNLVQEEMWIVEQVEELYKNGVQLSDVAVIYRKHQQADNIINLLEKKSIPYIIRKKVNLLDLPIVQQLLNVLRYLNEESRRPHSAEHILFELMHYHFIGIGPNDILKITTYASRKDIKKTWREIITDVFLLDELNLENKTTVAHLGKKINEWLSEVHNLTLQMLFEKIVNEGGVLNYILHSNEKVWLMEVVSTLFSFIQAESAKRPRLKISDFFDMIKQMESHDIPIPVDKTSSYNEDGVYFTTAHSAKGLEFKYVFLIGCTSDKWEKARGNTGMYSLPDTLTYTKDENKIESSRRLFYVALTRSKEFLHISYARQDNNGRGQEPSQFIAEILDRMDMEVINATVSNDKLFELSVAALSEPEKPVVSLFDEDYINNVLENFVLSASSLNSYLDCPLSFYYDYILRVPSAKNDSAAFGIAVHYAINKLFTNMKKSAEQKFPPVEEFLRDFKFELYRNKDSFTDKQFELRLALGEKILPEFYEKYHYKWNKIVVTEYFVRNVEVAGIPINGKLDKIEFNGTDVNVVDYKTGNPKYSKDKMQPPDEKNPDGGDYWRQIIFYKILLDNNRLQKWKMISGQVDFVEKDEKTNDFPQYKIAIEKEHINIVIAQIRDSYQKIMNHEFNTGCGKPDCYWCNFVKEHNLALNSPVVVDAK